MLTKLRKKIKGKHATGGVFVILFLFVSYLSASYFFAYNYNRAEADTEINQDETSLAVPVLDKEAYDLKLWQIANATTSPVIPVLTASTTASSTEVIEKPLWSVKTVYPNAGAILPFKRIIAYYGNLYSTKMGVLGEYPEAEMFRRFDEEIRKWEEADPNTPVQPAIDYIAVTAQGSAGEDGMYRFRMPDTEMEKILALAEKKKAIVILEVQPGLSPIQTEIEALEKYLKLPQVHLAIDPEFCMKDGRKPGIYIGSVKASEVNTAINYLSKLVQENSLPPKVLIVHRFTQNMVTNAQDIAPTPEVQVVMDMDGWGQQARKLNTYKEFIYNEPVQFTGFKLFYKNDFREENSRIMTPAEVLRIKPQPVFIQYQ